MAVATPCQTPGAQFHTGIAGNQITVWVELPEDVVLDEQQSEMLKANLHNAVELVLARYWPERV